MSDNAQSPPRGNYVLEAWLVIVLGAVFGAGLAGVHAAWSPRIQQNRIDETIAQIPHLVPGATDGERIEVGKYVVYRALANGETKGWVIAAGGQGFADRIELLIGVDVSASALTGLYVLDQKETPGLGNRISELEWHEQFRGQPATAPLTVTRSEPGASGEIRAVTGATISSESVCNIINRALADVRDQLPGVGK